MTLMPENTEARIQELSQENELLLEQLHVVQEELERYFRRCEELESQHSLMPLPAWVDEEVPSLRAEKLRLTALVEAARKVHSIEKSQSFPAQLGSMLIRAARNPARMLGLPVRLLAAWLRRLRRNIPRRLGGPGYSRVIDAYRQGGFEAVDRLVSSARASAIILADAYLALATRLREDGQHPLAVEAAWRAYALDPQPYRLKWLALRTHEAGDVISAEALLDLLPEDTEFSKAESCHASVVREEARRARRQLAEQDGDYKTRCTAHEQRLRALDQAHRRSLAQLREAESKLLALAREEQRRRQLEQQLAERQAQLEAAEAENGRLAEAKGQLQAECAALVSRLEQAEQARAALQAAQVDWAEEKAALSRQRDVLAQELAERQAQLEAAEAENGRLAEAKGQLQAECAALVSRLEQAEQARAALQAAQVDWAEEKAALSRQRDALAQELAERQAQLEAAEAENGRLAEAKGQLEADLATRLRLMDDEVLRAEAQLDLLKALVVRESGP